MEDALAYWVVGPGRAEIRPTPLPDPGQDDVLVRTLSTGVSRGTEALVLRGGVPGDQQAAMRAPFQEGDFPWPVKYGYLNVGIVEAGPPDLLGRVVFCLFPHQTRYVVPACAVTLVPDGVPPARAVLAGAVETAINALWDAPPRVGDRVCVVGAGMVGCCVARLAAQIPGVDVTLVDTCDARGSVAVRLGVGFAAPASAPGEQDLVFHTSATSAGLQTAISLLRREGEVVELSWYGDAAVTVDLGGAFHSKRLGLRASQVGTVSAGRRTPGERVALALDLLRDPAFDVLCEPPVPFRSLPSLMMTGVDGLCQVVDYA